MRPIDADHLLRYEKFHREVFGEELSTKDIVMAIKNAPTIEVKPMWISTKDRLPGLEEGVIVRLKNGIHTDITTACYFPWASMPDPSDGLFWDHVTHWMPCPEIPKDGV